MIKTHGMKMTRLASMCCVLTLIVGCGTSESEPDAASTMQSASDAHTIRIHVNGFRKSKSGAT